jgi:hypothetical protein
MAADEVNGTLRVESSGPFTPDKIWVYPPAPYTMNFHAINPTIGQPYIRFTRPNGSPLEERRLGEGECYKTSYYAGYDLTLQRASDSSDYKVLTLTTTHIGSPCFPGEIG